jgi:hypothetical protein
MKLNNPEEEHRFEAFFRDLFKSLYAIDEEFDRRRAQYSQETTRLLEEAENADELIKLQGRIFKGFDDNAVVDLYERKSKISEDVCTPNCRRLDSGLSDAGHSRFNPKNTKDWKLSKKAEDSSFMLTMVEVTWSSDANAQPSSQIYYSFCVQADGKIKITDWSHNHHVSDV